MKVTSFLLILYSSVWIWFKVDAACEDQHLSFCNNVDCTQPGINQYCKKTCKVCTSPEQKCNHGFYRETNGLCNSCANRPAILTSSYNTSCGQTCGGDGLWGLSCSQTCNTGCVSGRCNRWTGACDGSCKLCYTGVKCEIKHENCNCSPNGKCECQTPYYGDGCVSRCSENCIEGICDNDGRCKYGCVSGWYGRKCDVKCLTCRNANCSAITGTCVEGCTTGYYGIKCDTICFNTCVDHACDEVSGECTKGCRPGRYGGKCHLYCPNNCKRRTCRRKDGRCKGCKLGYFGDDCDKLCPVNCKNNTCHQDGRCDRGCTPGYFDQQCRRACSKNCKINKCRLQDGRCEDGCPSGWFGDTCNKSCPAKCKTDSCDGSDGSCQGCQEGYKGSHCNITCFGQCTECDQYRDICSFCNSGWYGKKCDNNCQTCLGDNCTNPDGFCVIGCKEGWFGYSCKTKCNRGCKEERCYGTSGKCTEGCNNKTFGEFCNNTCSDHCYNRLCYTRIGDLNNPTCAEGCVDGWWGDYCQEQCPLYCVKCFNNNGTCIQCQEIRHGIDCILTVHLESQIQSNKMHQWILTAVMSVFIFLVMILLIRSFRKQLYSCILRSPRGIYISAVPNNESDIPLQEVYPSSGHSDHPYASIEDEFSGGSFQGERSDRSMNQ